MKDLFINWEIAVYLKGLNYNEKCFAFYDCDKMPHSPIMVDDKDEYERTGYRTCVNSEIPEQYIAVPTYDQIISWLFKEHQILVRPSRLSMSTLCWVIDTGLRTESYANKDQALFDAIKLIK